MSFRARQLERSRAPEAARACRPVFEQTLRSPAREQETECSAFCTAANSSVHRGQARTGTVSSSGSGRQRPTCSPDNSRSLSRSFLTLRTGTVSSSVQRHRTSSCCIPSGAALERDLPVPSTLSPRFRELLRPHCGHGPLFALTLSRSPQVQCGSTHIDTSCSPLLTRAPSLSLASDVPIAVSTRRRRRVQVSYIHPPAENTEKCRTSCHLAARPRKPRSCSSAPIEDHLIASLGLSPQSRLMLIYQTERAP